MILALTFISLLNYIPKEFDYLKRKAIKSSRLKVLSNLKEEPIISPENPLITDSFEGTVLHPIFGISVKELQGVAISKDKKHIALIVDRNTQVGQRILEEQSVYFGEKNITVSLSKKFADDGEIAIFNTTEIDPLSAFNNFNLALSPFSKQCKTNFGNQLGARCDGFFDLNWDKDNNKPKEVNIPIIPSEVQKYVKFYGGVYAESHASVMIKRRGFSIQVECEGGIDVNAGAGFHIDSFNSTGIIPSEFTIGNFDNLVLGKGSLNIFNTNIQLQAKLIARILAKDISFMIPHDIDIFRYLTIHLKKDFTISTKHVKSSDFEKSVKVDKINTQAIEKSSDPEKDYLEAEFNGTFLVQVGIKVDVYSNDQNQFSAEVGPEVGLKLTLGLNTEKCTFPGLYGSFNPFVNSYCTFAGKLTLAGFKLLNTQKTLKYSIYNKEVFDGCFFDGSSSKELEKSLLQDITIKRSIIKSKNPSKIDENYLYDPNYQPLIYIGETDEKIMYLGFKYISFDPNMNINDYVFIPEYQKFGSIGYIAVGPHGINDDVSYPFQEKNFINKGFSFTVIKNESQPIIMGNQFDYSNFEEIKNFRSKFMSSKDFSQNISLILHTKENGYFVDPSKYTITDEVYDRYVDSIYHWIKIKIQSLNQKENKNVFINFHSFLNDNIPIINGQQMYYSEDGVSQVQPSFDDFSIRIVKTKDYKRDDILLTFELIDVATTSIIGNENIIYDDIIKKTFTKKISDYEITFNVENDGDDQTVEYIIELEPDFINQIQNIPDFNMKGIVSRAWDIEQNGDIDIFKWEPQTKSISMNEGELYGTFFFYFNDPGFDIKNNKNIYAFLQLQDASILLKSSKPVDENEKLFVIKLEMGITVTYYGDNIYLLSIPFRRHTRSPGPVSVTLYSIYQSYEKNDSNKENAYCSNFPLFQLKPNNNFYVGCVRTYVDHNDFTDNKWDHYPSTAKVSYKDYPEKLPTKKDAPFSKLHVFKLQQSQSQSSESVKVVAKQRYFNFPLEARTMIIEDETVSNFKNYASNEFLKISCPRCKSVYNNSFINGNPLGQQSDNFLAIIDDTVTGGFVLEAICKNEEQTYCIFEYDLSNDGITLLEFNTLRHPAEIQSIKNILDDKYESLYPGVEEIYDITTDKIPNSRLIMNCRRQIVPARTDIIYLTKPWEGKINKISTHLESDIIEIEIIQTNRDKSVEIKMIGKGFNKKNPDISDQQIIPFNPKFFLEDDEKFKELLSQIGITIKKSKEQTNQDNDVTVDNDGVIVVKKELFNEKKLKNSIKKNKIDLLDIPSENYKLTHSVRDLEEGGGSSGSSGGSGSSGDSGSSGSSGKSKTIVDQDASPEVFDDFKINVAYIGGSTIMNFRKQHSVMQKIRKLFGKINPSPNYLHTAAWIGLSDSTDDTLGVILVYGRYYPIGSDKTFLYKNGARAYAISLGGFKKLFKAFDIKKFIPQKEIYLNEFLNDIKLKGNWTADEYSWSKRNCQHFTASCIDILQVKRFKPEYNDSKIFPKIIMKSILLSESNSTTFE